MIFKKGYLYHIYNQGNNKQNIFYNRDNYLFFLKKVNSYILPYADVLAWCLMPNHFHFMVLVNNTEFNSKELIHQMTNKHNEKSHQMNISIRTLNTSIAIMLRSYTRAINKQENRTGSLFKPHTKAECINCFKGAKPSFIQSNVLINNHLPKKQYPQVCFDYIHQNPVKANLVKNAASWEYSSAKDYAELRNNKLVNKMVAKEYVESSKP